jgi:hypothetical protein
MEIKYKAQRINIVMVLDELVGPFFGILYKIWYFFFGRPISSAAFVLLLALRFL